MELMCAGTRRRGRAESAAGEEQAKGGCLPGRGGRIGGCEFVEEASRGEDKVTFSVGAGESSFAFEVAGVDGDDGWIVFKGVSDEFGVAQGGVGVEEVVGSSCELDPLAVGSERGEMGG